MVFTRNEIEGEESMRNKFCLTLAGAGIAALAVAMPLQFDLTTMSGACFIQARRIDCPKESRVAPIEKIVSTKRNGRRGDARRRHYRNFKFDSK